MTWPEVLPVVVGALSLLAALLGAVWTLGRIFRPWMREAARTEADRVAAQVEALKTNDLPHLEERIDKRLAEAREDRAAMRAEFGARLDRMESRILARLPPRGATTGPDPDPAQKPRGPSG